MKLKIKEYCPIKVSPNSELGELERINLEIERKNLQERQLLGASLDRYNHLVLYYWIWE